MKRKGIFINMSMQFYRWLQGTEIAINHKFKWWESKPFADQNNKI